MNARRILRKMTHFFHLRRERLIIKATYNTVLKHESFFPSFVLPAIVLKIMWHINHVDISLFPPRVHHCHMLSRGETICFSRGPWKIALMPSKRKKTKREQAHFIEVAPLWKIKPMCVREEGMLPYIKALE